MDKIKPEGKKILNNQALDWRDFKKSGTQLNERIKII
jgi:hypothetical protein